MTLRDVETILSVNGMVNTARYICVEDREAIADYVKELEGRVKELEIAKVKLESAIDKPSLTVACAPSKCKFYRSYADKQAEELHEQLRSNNQWFDGEGEISAESRPD